jgi:hypothetical protein
VCFLDLFLFAMLAQVQYEVAIPVYITVSAHFAIASLVTYFSSAVPVHILKNPHMHL